LEHLSGTGWHVGQLYGGQLKVAASFVHRFCKLATQHSGIVTTTKPAIDPRAESEVLDRTTGDVGVNLHGTPRTLILEVQRLVMRRISQLRILNFMHKLLVHLKVTNQTYAALAFVGTKLNGKGSNIFMTMLNNVIMIVLLESRHFALVSNRRLHC
jgi:hypothetical protein